MRSSLVREGQLQGRTSLSGVAEKSAEERQSCRESSRGRELVLVADDDRISRITMGNALASEGLMVQYAGDGAEAIARYMELSPDLVIMDAMMPVMNGFDACREIAAKPGGSDTPILMVTGLEHDSAVEHAFSVGAADFITKPINLAVLKRRVKRMLHARRSEQRIKHLAFSDALTGLPNRVAFFERLREGLEQSGRDGQKLAVLFIDMDMFKDVNDNLGHAAGDALLIQLAKRLGHGIRTQDTLARLGGDEFVILLRAVDGVRGAEVVAKNILDRLKPAFRIAGREVRLGASIGIAIYPDDAVTKETLLKHADAAMYRAKQIGRNNYQFFTSAMSAVISERIDIETELRRAMEQDEFVLHFQPKRALASGRLVGAEALLRWHHPTRGLVAPDSFLGIAEESEFIEHLGEWVILETCGQLQQWRREAGFEGRVAINVSARQFRAVDFVDRLRRCLSLTGAPPHFLEIEVTENSVLEDADNIIATLRHLASMGVKVAIDNFGVGYSSFSHLMELPVEGLKIDRSFIQALDSSRAAGIAAGMIQLGHHLGLEVVAEGVENESQRSFLEAHGCDVVQGFLVGRPVPAESFFDLYIKK